MKPASHSIYRRLTGWLLGGLGLLLLVTGVMLAAVIEQRLQSEYDRALLTQARALVALTDQDTEGIEFDLIEGAMPEFEIGSKPEYFQMWRFEGSEFVRSPSLVHGNLPKQQGWSETPRFADHPLADGRAGRSVQIDFLANLDLDDEDEEALQAGLAADALVPESMVLVVARERERLDTLLTNLRLTLVAAGAIVMVLTVLLVRFVVASGLRPLADIRAQVAQLDADSLDARLQPRQHTEELDGMVAQFNGLLERLQGAFERERQFSADVAHELRTPLAELRSLAEVGGRWPEDKALVKSFFKDVLDATLQMERIVLNLLALARCERGLDSVETAPFDLVEQINTALQQVSLDAKKKNLRFHYEGPKKLVLPRGCDQWALILTNLFSNATAYSPSGSAIVASINAQATTFSVSLANQAPHLRQADLPLMFQRLWRKDPARTGGHHAGLGLTLINAYAQQLGLSIETRLQADKTFCLTLSGLPDERHDGGK